MLAIFDFTANSAKSKYPPFIVMLRSSQTLSLNQQWDVTGKHTCQNPFLPFSLFPLHRDNFDMIHVPGLSKHVVTLFT